MAGERHSFGAQHAARQQQQYATHRFAAAEGASSTLGLAGGIRGLSHGVLGREGLSTETACDVHSDCFIARASIADAAANAAPGGLGCAFERLQ